MMTNDDTGTDEVFDVVVIGGGPVGENAADYAVRDSNRTCALVDEHLLGGECSYYACMPSKALLRPLAVAATARNLEGIAPAPGLDAAGLLARRDTWVSHYDDSGQVDWAGDSGLTVVRGSGRLVGERTVEVRSGDTVRTLRAREAVVLATGSAPAVPAPYRAAEPWTTHDATGVHEIPPRLAVIGGGVAACEAATWMAALGSQVTMLVRDEALLSRNEPFAGEAVLRSLLAAGVEVRLGTEVSELHRTAPRPSGLGRIHGGPVRIATAGKELEVDEVLVATGRDRRLDRLGLDSVGLSADDLMWGSQALPGWLHGAGDVLGSPQLTHWGKYQARVVGEEIAARAEGRTPPPRREGVPIPQVVFTDPEVAATGLTAAEAREKGVDVRIVDQPLTAASGAALLRDDADGQVRLVLDRGSNTLVGATFVGPEVAELVHAATIAIVGRVPLDVLRDAVPSFPTASEIWLRLIEQALRDD